MTGVTSDPKKLISQAVIMLFILFYCLSPSFGQAKDAAALDGKDDRSYAGEFTYIIGGGDLLEIKVWQHPDLDTKAVVRPDGKIAFPFIDEVYVCNLTPLELKKTVAERLSTAIRDPQVTVNVVSFESKKFFVLGEVERPGVYPFDGKITVLEAISRAAYKHDTAALKSVVLIRPGKPKDAKRLNIYNILSKGDVKDNVTLAAGDIVFVPKTFIADLNTFIDQFFTKTDPALQYYLDIMDVKHGRRAVQ